MSEDSNPTALQAAEPATDDTARFGHAAEPAVRAHLCDVLIADDSGPSREILSAILRNFARGLTVREARNGVDALQLWEQLSPRITMLDLDMPGLDGMSALQKMQSIDPKAFVAIVSGTGSVDNVRRALEFGASGFVVKPYKPQRILDLLERYSKLTGHALVKP
jgi:YesN/AraC family two-component response regulator